MSEDNPVTRAEFDKLKSEFDAWEECDCDQHLPNEFWKGLIVAIFLSIALLLGIFVKSYDLFPKHYQMAGTAVSCFGDRVAFKGDNGVFFQIRFNQDQPALINPGKHILMNYHSCGKSYYCFDAMVELQSPSPNPYVPNPVAIVGGIGQKRGQVD
jgi:hypothetical protein